MVIPAKDVFSETMSSEMIEESDKRAQELLAEFEEKMDSSEYKKVFGTDKKINEVVKYLRLSHGMTHPAAVSSVLYLAELSHLMEFGRPISGEDYYLLSGLIMCSGIEDALSVVDDTKVDPDILSRSDVEELDIAVELVRQNGFVNSTGPNYLKGRLKAFTSHEVSMAVRAIHDKDFLMEYYFK